MATKANNKNIIGELKSIIGVIFVALMIRIFVIELFFVPTESMNLTILKREYIFSTKYSYGFSNYSIPFSPNLFKGRIFASLPKRGDIVITKSDHDMSTRFIKRVIGLPGDKIEIINDVIHVNNQPIPRQEIGVFSDEAGLKYVKYRETLPNGRTYYAYKAKFANFYSHDEDLSNFGPYYVPEDHFFLMGDHRDGSGDSRAQMGFVPFEYIIAKARFILFSTKELLWQKEDNIIDQVSRIWTWLKNIRFNRIFHNLYEKEKNE